MKTKAFITIFICALLALPVLANKPIPKKNRIDKLSLAALTRNIEFGFCKSDIVPAKFDQLDELARYLVENKSAIALRGHADAIGTYVGNWKMSEKRSNAVKLYLIGKGVAEDKIVTTPFGSTVPIASNKTASGRQRNRRVELVVAN